MKTKSTIVHTLHSMFITLKSKNETKAVEWLNKQTKISRKALATYWTLNGFGHYVAYLRTEG